MSGYQQNPVLSDGFGELLRKSRLREKISQEELAEMVGTTAKSISRWENGQASPQRFYFDQLVNILNLNSELTQANKRIWYVPFQQNPYFTGRSSILHGIRERFQSASNFISLFLVGMGGIGKSQIALEYAYLYKELYQVVMWVRAESLDIDFREIARLLQLPGSETANLSILRNSIKYWLEAHENWLLIVDNAEDIDMLNLALPDQHQGQVGHTLITTQSNLLGPTGSKIDIPKLNVDDSINLLLHRAGIHLMDLSTNTSIRDQAETLVSLLDCLPLAIDQAGAYIEETASDISVYLDRFTHHSTHLLDWRGDFPYQHPHSVLKTINLSLGLIEHQGSLGFQLLKLCAFLHAEGIPETLVERVGKEFSSPLLEANPIGIDAAIKALRHHSLIHREASSRTFNIHRLVQEVLLSMISENDRKAFLYAISQAFLSIFPDYRNLNGNKLPPLLSLQPYMPHALAWLKHIKQSSFFTDDICEAIYRIGCVFQYSGERVQALGILQFAQQSIEKIYGWKSKENALYLRGVGILLTSNARLEEALSCFQDILEIQQEVLGRDHFDLAMTYYYLANLTYQHGKYHEGLGLIQHCLMIQKYSDQRKYEMAMALNMQGIIQSLLQFYSAAHTSFNEALALYKQELGDKHFYNVSVHRNAGYTLIIEGKMTEAITPLKIATEICNESLGPNSLLKGDILNRLGHIHFQAGNLEQAERYYEEAQEVLEKQLDGGAVSLAEARLNLSELYLNQGKRRKAKKLLNDCRTFLGLLPLQEDMASSHIVLCIEMLIEEFIKKGQLLDVNILSKRLASLHKIIQSM